jgi:hypothetical protein
MISLLISLPPDDSALLATVWMRSGGEICRTGIMFPVFLDNFLAFKLPLKGSALAQGISLTRQ